MTSDVNTEPGDIGLAPIDPAAEPAGSPVPGRGQQENQFFAEFRLTHELNLVKHDLGFIGKCFGSSAQAPTNIAAILIVCLVVFIIASAFATSNDNLNETRKWAFSIITLVVGFLFGAGTKTK